MPTIPCRVIVVPRTGDLIVRDVLAPTRKWAEVEVWAEESRRRDIVGAVAFEMHEKVTP